jgi:polysaccharide biosynthesis/export protein
MKSRVAVAFIVIQIFLAGSLWAAEENSQPAAPVVPVAVEADVSDRYLVGPGDLLDIFVWKDETLTRTVYVLPDGRISFPLIGEVVAAGKTIEQLKKEFEGKLARYVPDAIMTIDVKQANSLIIFVLGRVNNPGRFVLNNNLNVMQALATAGGLNPFAKKGKIKIFRYEGKKTSIFSFDYNDVSEGNKMEQNIQLMRGDVIVVP